MKKLNFNDREFVFTGVRDAGLKNFLINHLGGIVKDGITKNTTDLIVKDIDSTSSKVMKAYEMGINIIQIDDFKDLVGYIEEI